MYVLTLADRLDGYQCDRPFGQWDVQSLAQALNVRIAAVREHLYGHHHGLNEVFPLIVLQPVLRGFFLGTGEEFDGLALEASQLEVIAQLEPGNPLLLRQYARAKDRLSQYARVLSFDELDEFQLYRAHRQSFYLSDEARPTFVNISPGGGEVLRLEALSKQDEHAVPYLDGNSVIEVTCLHETRSIPVYKPILGQRIALVVHFINECRVSRVWLISWSEAR
jgi:hypothetical protein